MPYLVQKDNSVPEGYKIIGKAESSAVYDIKDFKEYKGEKNESYT